MWALGLFCGIGASAAGGALLLPIGFLLMLGGGLGLAALALRRLVWPPRRAVVWQEPSWNIARDRLAGPPRP